jgi:hypothetical protein
VGYLPRLIPLITKHSKALFGLKERKWKNRKLWKSMNELEPKVSPNSSTDFRNFISFHTTKHTIRIAIFKCLEAQ